MQKEAVKTSKAHRWLRGFLRLLLAGAMLILLSAIGLWTFFEFRSPPKTLRVLSSIALPGHGLLTFPDYPSINSHFLYVGYCTQDKLIIIDTTKGKVIAAIGGLKDIHGCAIDKVDELGFTSDGGDDTVGIIDLKTNALLAKVPGGKGPDAIIFDDKDHLVYAADGSGKTATLIDPLTRDSVATIPLGGSPEFPVADPSTGLVYQNLEDTSEVVVVDPLQRSVTARYQIAPGSGPTGIALDPLTHRLYVVCGNKKLVVLNEVNGRVIASLPIGSGVDGVAFDPTSKRIYASNSSATMTIIQQDDADSYHVLENAPTPLGGHSVAIDLATHRIYVICAGIGVSKVAVFEPKN